MQYSQFFKNKNIHKKAHGGDLSIRRRKSKRLLSIRNPFHVTLRTDFSRGKRNLLRHKNLIYKILGKASRRFRIKIHEQAICGNHIHLLVKGQRKIDLQNFFRVVAGHIAQQILEQYPILADERATVQMAQKEKRGNAPETRKELQYQRKFWCALLYSRLVAWGRDFKNVMSYIEMNTLEAIGWISYQARKSRYVDKRWGNAPASALLKAAGLANRRA